MKRHLPIVVLLACVIAFAAGIARLFELRFDVGDIYPEYSSLRSDPLGTMAFYESLGRLPGLAVQRDFSTANRLPAGPGATYFHIAAPMESWTRLPEATFDEIERFANAGGSLVITMFPMHSMISRRPVAAEPQAKVTSIQQRWGVDFDFASLSQTQGVYTPALVEIQGELPLPETLEWHSGAVFKKLTDAWKPIYAREEGAVLIERRFGPGRIVIATDSFFLSNEAMQMDRQPELLAWLIVSSRNIFFDEAHLGVTESAGVANLMRKYRLHWFVAALILLTVLFVWKNSMSLLPSRPPAAAQGYVTGKDAAAGFDNLLRRHIAPRDLLATCFAEWKKSAAQTGKYSTTRIAQAEAAFQAEQSRPDKDRGPVKAYQTISAILRTQTK